MLSELIQPYYRYLSTVFYVNTIPDMTIFRAIIYQYYFFDIIKICNFGGLGENGLKLSLLYSL